MTLILYVSVCAFLILLLKIMGELVENSDQLHLEALLERKYNLSDTPESRKGFKSYIKSRLYLLGFCSVLFALFGMDVLNYIFS